MKNGVFEWDDFIENDGQGFIILKEGDYEFTVSGFDRGYFNGSDKIPACPRAELTLSIESPEGIAQCKSNLLLCEQMEWKLTSFFRAIGQKKHGERLKMDWDHVLGTSGACHIKPRDYQDKSGTTRQSNDVDYFIDYDPKFINELREKNAKPSKKSTETATMDDEDIPF